MKLLLNFIKTQKMVVWNHDDIYNFPHTVSYKDSYYQWFMYDFKDTKDIDYELCFTKIADNMLPHDGYGNVFPVMSIEDMFNLTDSVKCDCGAEKVYGPNATHVDWCQTRTQNE